MASFRGPVHTHDNLRARQAKAGLVPWARAQFLTSVLKRHKMPVQ
jgi:hypothetical protein